MNTKRNILFIESGTSGGGSFESLYQHLKVIKRQRYNPVVVYLNNNRYIEPVKALGVPVYLLTDLLYSNHVKSLTRSLLLKIRAVIDRYMPSRYLSFIRVAHRPLVASLEQVIQKEKIDLIHLNVQIGRDLFGLFASEKAKVPCISHLRSMRGGGFDRHRADYANRIVSMFIANSSSTKQYWKKKGIDENRTRVIYNAIDKTEIQPVDIRRTWGIDGKARFIIGCVGNFSSGKGQGFLLETFSRLVSHGCDAALLLAGDGPLRTELVRKAEELGITDRVIFAGYLKNVRDVIAGLDLLVLPSETEAFGRVLLEAMQAETAVIATSTGGIPEIVTHEYNGLLVRYGDHEELQRAMERLLTDEGLRRGLIGNGRLTAARFSMDVYEDILEDIYRDVLLPGDRLMRLPHAALMGGIEPFKR